MNLAIDTDGLVTYDPPPAPIPGIPQTISELIDLRAREIPSAVALLDRQRRLTFAELADESLRAASVLVEAGVRAGDRVAVSLPNRVELVIHFYATQRIGAIWCGINPALTNDERVAVLADADARLFVGTEPTVDGVNARMQDLPLLVGAMTVERFVDLVAKAKPRAAADLPAPNPHRPAALAHTSGTTGRPKGVVHAEHNLLLAGYAFNQVSPADVVGSSLPLTILNLVILAPIGALTVGGRCACLDRGDAVGLADQIEQHGVQRISVAPATVYDWVHNDAITTEKLRCLTGLGVGGSSTPEPLRIAYPQKFGRAFTSAYGLTEAPTTLTREFETDDRPPGSSGKAVPQVEIVIVDDNGLSVGPGEVGEICARPIMRGPFADVYRPMLGYWRQPEATAKALRIDSDGLVRLHTGDVGFLDEQGFLHVTDRKSELIIRGGANVYPAEVERVLLSHDEVGDCAVVGRDHDRLGQEVVAFVQRKPNGVVDAATLTSFVAQHLARYKVPAVILFVESFPRNAMGKIAKRTLEAELRSGARTD
jgi:acyl-CoA synthetase (AMP-forming)/AMP-acid ligase II